MTGHIPTRYTFGTILTGILVAAAISFSAAQTMVQPRPLKQFLEENGWVSLPIPDKRMGAGSVIKVTRKDGTVSVQWLGDLRRCGITDREFRFVRGKYPAIGIGMSFRVRASVAAGYIAKLEGTADLDKADAAVMQIVASGGDAVDYRALMIWLAQPSTARRLPQVCSNFLAQEDSYLVTEAFRISKADYHLVDRDGAKLAVAGAAFERVDPSSSSTLSVADDLYFGVRGVKALAPGLSEPSREPRAVPDADGLLHLMEP